MTRKRISSDYLYDLINGVLRTEVLKASLKLDLFSTISQGLNSAERISKARGWSKEAITLLLDSLSSLGFLKKKEDFYSLPKTSEVFFVRGSEGYGGGFILSVIDSEVSERLVEAIEKGKRRICDVLEEEFEVLWAQDASLESRRHSRLKESLWMWRKAGIKPEKKRKLLVLDLASGCGIKSFVLAERNPLVRIVCVDRGVVLEVARKLASKLKILDQVEFVEGDILEMDFGDEKYDAVLLGQLTYYWSLDQVRNVFEKVRRSLKEGGRFLLHVSMADGKLSPEASLDAIFCFLFSEEGRLHGFSDYKRILEEKGFLRVEKYAPKVLVAYK